MRAFATLRCAVPVLALWLGIFSGQTAEEPAFELAGETLLASDIRLAQSTLGWQARQGALDFRLSMVGAWLGLDFQPAAFDVPLFAPRSVDHQRYSGQVDLQWRIADRLTSLTSLGGYRGFTGYRSAWISEYYRQQTQGFPGFEAPDPHGGNGSAGLRWEYLPGNGLLETTAGYSRDQIAPSYDDIIDPDAGLIGYRPFRADLNTINWRVRTENVLSRRIRTALEFRFTSQSLRGPRFSGLGWLNYAATERLVLRAEGGYATERFELAEPLPGDPPPVSTRFRGGWLGGAAEVQVGGGWSLFGSGRYYRDNGEIETSLSFSSASPGVRTWQVEGGLRWVGDRHSFKVSGGPYFNDYSDVPFNISAFGPLYRDRSFGFFQFAYQYRL